MAANSLLFGERSLTTVAALFGEARQARDAAERVVRDAQVAQKRVEVVGPGDPALARKLESDESGIVRSLIKSHVTLGIVGLVAGIVIGAALILSRVDWALLSPYFTLGLAAVFGALGGMMLGGLVGMRPDRGLLDVRVATAVQAGRWAVIVHPIDALEEERTIDVLGRERGDVLQTL